MRLKSIIFFIFIFSVCGNIHSQEKDSVGLDASKYLLQKRYRPADAEFVNDKWSDNTFLSISAGVHNLFGQDFGYGPVASFSYGKWFGKSNAVRATFAGGYFYRNADLRRNINFALTFSHMFNISSYVSGYDPKRFVEFSTVEGLGYLLATVPDKRPGHCLRLHLGINANMRLGRDIDFFIEPLATFTTGEIHRSRTEGWHNYYLGYSLSMGLSYRFPSSKSGRVGPVHDREFFLTFMGGFQFQNSEMVVKNIGVFKSAGPSAMIGAGKWFSDYFAWRGTLFFGYDKWQFQEAVGTSLCYYGGARVDAILDVYKLASGKNSVFGAAVVLGPEVGYFYKDDKVADLGKLYVGLNAGIQVRARFAKRWTVFLEPAMGILPYSAINPLDGSRSNYYDGLFRCNLGIEIAL